MSRLRAPHALAVLSGVLLALSFPKFGHGAVAFVALVPLLCAIAAAPARGLRLGYLHGAVAALGLLYWTALTVIQFGRIAAPVAMVVMLLLCLAFALFPLLFGWALGRLVATLGPRGLLFAPVLWTATELLRAHTFFRFPWCLVGYATIDVLPFAQVASLFGVYGASFLVVLVNALLALALVSPADARRATASAAGLLLAWGGLGAWALATPVQETGRVRVGLVQASVIQDEKWDPEFAERNVARHERLSREAAAQGARLIVWPESAVPSYFDHDPAVASRLRALARQTGAFVLFGNDDLEFPAEGGRRPYVGAKLLTPEGELALRYRKMRLVPFGEYVPMQPLLTVGGRYAAKLVQQVADFEPGTEAAVAAGPGGSLGAFICYEAVFPDLSRAFVRGGAELLVNVTNDGWYGRTSAPHQHLAMARMRSIETGRTLVRAANTGITAIVDPRGRLVARTALFDETALVGEAAFADGRTLYVRTGDALALACLLAAALGVALARPRLAPRDPARG